MVLTERAEAAATHRNPKETRHKMSEGPRMSRRQIEVLGLMVQGLSKKEIATTLQITYDNVRDDVKKGYNYLGASNKISAALLAGDKGILTSEDVTNALGENVQFTLSQGEIEVLAAMTRNNGKKVQKKR